MKKKNKPMIEKIEILPGGSRPESRCVVCTKALQPSDQQFSVHLSGMEYPVCCVSCSEKFGRNPSLYTVA